MGTSLATRQKIAKAIENRTNFRFGNISGDWTKEHNVGYTGRLPDFLRDQLNAANRDKDVYVVYSYNTPIAWTSDKEWFIPEVSYSVTTNHHQNVIRTATLPPGKNPYLN